MAKKYTEGFYDETNEAYYVRDAEAHEAIGQLQTDVAAVQGEVDDISGFFTKTYTASATSAAKEYDGTEQETSVTAKLTCTNKIGTTNIGTTTVAGVTYSWSGNGGTNSSAVITRTNVGTSSKACTITYDGATYTASGKLTIYVPELMFAGPVNDVPAKVLYELTRAAEYTDPQTGYTWTRFNKAQTLTSASVSRGPYVFLAHNRGSNPTVKFTGEITITHTMRELGEKAYAEDTNYTWAKVLVSAESDKLLNDFTGNAEIK